MKHNRSLIAVLMLALTAGFCHAQYVDELDDASGFKDKKGPVTVEAADGKVTVGRTEAADAYVLYRNKDTGQWFDIAPENEVVEVDFSEFKDEGGAEVRIQLRNAAGKWAGAGDWLKLVEKPGRQTLTSVKEVAEKAGMPDASAFQLTFRVKGKPTSAMVIDRIRIADKPTP